VRRQGNGENTRTGDRGAADIICSISSRFVTMDSGHNHMMTKMYFGAL